MKVQFLGGAFLGDAPPLVEGFVEDADAVEGAAVVAGGDAGALSINQPGWPYPDGGAVVERGIPFASTSYTPNKPSKHVSSMGSAATPALP